MNSPPQSWFECWMYPLVIALEDKNELAYKKAHQELDLAVEQNLFDDDITATARYILSYYKYLKAVKLGQRHLLKSTLDEALIEFEIAPLGPVSKHYRDCFLLQLRIIADDMGTFPLSRGEFDELQDALNYENLNTEQWFYLSKYYFSRRDTKGIARAYEQYMDQSSNWAREYVWRRFDVMVKLLDGRATELDLELLIDSMVVPGCLTEYENVFMPVIRGLGLANEKLRIKAERRRIEFKRNESQAELEAI